MAKRKALSSVQFHNPGRPHWVAVLWLLSALLLSACGGDGGSPNDPNNPSELKDPQLTLQSDAAVTLNIGGTHTNTASSTNGSTGSISYTSSDTDIADVDGNGLVTAKTVGDTTITATIEATATHKASSVSYDVTVIALQEAGLQFANSDRVTLGVGQTHTNTASSTNGSTGSISYESSNTEVADVDGNGLVTANAVGDITITATIAATATHKASSVSYDMEVIELKDSGLQFTSSDPVTLGVGGTHTNAASSTNGSTGSISYESSNTDVADVDDSGLVTAKAIGDTTITATIEATATHKASSVSYDVTVIALQEAGLAFANSGPVILGIGNSQANAANSTNGSTGSISYTSQDDSVAEVDANSGLVTAKAIGDTIITATIAATATHKEGSATYSISVELNDPALQLANSGVVTLRINDTHLTRIINKEGDGDIRYESDNPSVADIDSNGLVTAQAVGNATITVKVIETASYAADRAEYSVDVIGSGGTLSLWLEEDGAQWQMPKGFAGADFFGTTAADCLYEATGNCANATIKSRLLDGALFDDEGDEESKLKLGQATAYYQLTHDGGVAQGLFSAEKWEPRKDHQTVYYQDQFWIVGGMAKVNNLLGQESDVWSSPDAKNWQEVSEAANFQPTGRVGHQVVVYDFNDGKGEQLVLIGGRKNNDMWTSSDGQQWTKVAVTGPVFAERDDHQVVVFNNHLWVIGGLDKDNGNSRLSDVWYFEPDGEGSGSWKPHSDDQFPARYQHQAAVFDGKLWVMGGLDATNNRLNDVWVLDAEETSWEDKTTATGADIIDALKRANFQLAAFNNRLWLIGGKTDVNGDASLNDVWSLGKGAGATWQQELGQAPFAVRNGHEVVVARGRMWLFGGGKGDSNSGSNVNDVKNDVWSTVDGKLWRLESTEPEIGARSSHQVVAFAPTDTDGNVGERRLWLVGGQSGPTNKIWSSLDGVNWALATDAALFDARYDHSLAEFDGRLWLVGGRDASNNTIDDAWSSADGIDWKNETDRLPNNFPALAESQLVAFDNRLWLFGGANNDGSSSNEVWSLDQGDVTWQPQETSDFPRRRSHQIVVFSGDTLLMSGGTQGGARNDVWVSSDGIDWNELSDRSSSLYTGRDRHQMTIVDDGINQSLVLTGGTNNGDLSSALFDIWTSTDGGFSWEQKVSEAPFGKVLNHQVVTFNDGTGDKLWLIGGDILGNQIWRSEDGINWQKLLKSDFQFAEPESSPAP